MNLIEVMKENKYDDDRFFSQYAQMSRSVEGLQGAGEWHILPVSYTHLTLPTNREV